MTMHAPTEWFAIMQPLKFFESIKWGAGMGNCIWYKFYFVCVQLLKAEIA
jgi:hypothetical protein